MVKVLPKQLLTVGLEIEVNDRPVFSTEEGPNWAAAVVEDTLSDTFTFYLKETGRVGWRFYKDHETTWRLAK
jgi:hypothetical protein